MPRNNRSHEHALRRKARRLQPAVESLEGRKVPAIIAAGPGLAGTVDAPSDSGGAQDVVQPLLTTSVTAAQATHLSIAVNPPLFANANLPFSITVDALTATGAVAHNFNGPMTVALGSNPFGASLGGQLTVNAQSGVAVFKGLTINPTGSSLTLNVSSPGLTGATSSAFNVVLVVDTVSVSASPNPAPAGQNVTFTTTVKPFGVFAVPTGEVVFSIDNVPRQPVNLVNVNGTAQASISIGNLASGKHTVQATYIGNGTFAGGVAPSITETISAASPVTTTTLTSSANPSGPRQSVAFVAIVRPVSGIALPSGTVTFRINGQATRPVAIQQVNGQAEAVFTTSALRKGRYQVVAVYNGAGSYHASRSTVLVQTVS